MVDIIKRSGGTTHPLSRLQDEMTDLFGRFFGTEWPFLERGQGTGWWPAMDVAESDQAITVSAELPGLKAEDVDISVHGNVLTISGEKKDSSEQREGDRYHVERRYGSFQRRLQLPADVDVERIQAECRDGVLTVTLPKTEQAKPRRIDVKS